LILSSVYVALHPRLGVQAKPLCCRHHRAKQAPRWHLRQDQPGQMTWRLPHDREYQTAGEPYPI